VCLLLQMNSVIEQINNLFINVTNLKNELSYMKKIVNISPDNEEILRETELELRKMRRFFETTSTGTSLFPFGVEYVYVWELENNKYYVGYSENLTRRLDEHMSEEGSTWTKKHKPLSIIEIVRGNKNIEKQKTLQYMKEKGWENVRGAGWCLLEYKVCPPEVTKYLANSPPNSP